MEDNNDKKEIDLSIILSITTGRLYADFGEICKTLEFITGDDIFIHQVPRVTIAVGQYLTKLFPELYGVGQNDDVKGREQTRKFISLQKEKFGNTRTVGRMPKNEYYIYIDPVVEAEDFGFRVDSEMDDNDTNSIGIVMKQEQDPLQDETLTIIKKR